MYCIYGIVAALHDFRNCLLKDSSSIHAKLEPFDCDSGGVHINIWGLSTLGMLIHCLIWCLRVSAYIRSVAPISAPEKEFSSPPFGR